MSWEAANMNDDIERSIASAGSHPEAWAVEHGTIYPALCHTRCDALHVAARYHGSVVVPLYRSPALTDEERDVLDRLAHDASYRRMEWTERVLRGVLSRLG
jgi:hypothetical protein